MTDAPADHAPDSPRLAQTFAEVEDALLSRWPETKLEPSLDRIERSPSSSGTRSARSARFT